MDNVSINTATPLVTTHTMPNATDFGIFLLPWPWVSYCHRHHLWHHLYNTSDIISDIRAMSSLDLSENKLGGFYEYYSDDFYGSGYGSFTATPEGPKVIADAIRDMRAISSVNVLFNGIGTEQAKTLASVLKEHPTLRSLCGNSGEETELDMKGQKIGVEAAIMLAPEIAGNGALSSLNLAANCLCGIVNSIDYAGRGTTSSRGTYDASGNTTPLDHIPYSHSWLSVPRCYRPCQCPPRYEGVDEAWHQR
jgi:hypothetical protein